MLLVLYIISMYYYIGSFIRFLILITILYYTLLKCYTMIAGETLFRKEFRD